MQNSILTINQIYTESGIPQSSDEDFSKPIILIGNTEVDTFFENSSGDGLAWDTSYVLEDIQIQGSGAYMGALIIENSTRYIIIENCSIYYDFSILGETGGIFLKNCANIRIQNSYSESYRNAIFAKNSENIQIFNCTVQSGDEDGIHLFQSANCIVESNDVSLNVWYGICIKESHNVTVRFNYSYENIRYGIVILRSNNVTATENTVELNNYYGFYIDTSVNCTIQQNTYLNNTRGPIQIIGGEGNDIEEISENEDDTTDDDTDNDDQVETSIPGFSLMLLLGSSLIIALSLLVKKAKILHSRS